jgi:phytanoyl-CoA hydroxylase
VNDILDASPMTDKDSEKYERDGFAVFRNVLDPDLMRAVRQHVDLLLQHNITPENIEHHEQSSDPFWFRLISDDRLLDIAEKFIGPDIALFASVYVCKPPREGKPVLWHQDGSYWPIEPMKVVSLWLAVDDATPENSCMQVIPGTHRTKLEGLVPRTDVENVLGSSIDEALVDETKAVNLILRSGDVSVHHPNIIHGSKANLSDRRRCGLTIRYIPTSSKIVLKGNAFEPLTVDGKWPSAFHLRGDDPGVNEYSNI